MTDDTSADPKRRVPRRRRAEVLDAAARVFHAKGYDATTIQDIADEVGILKGSVYYYISSKEDVLFEVLQEVHESAITAVMEAVNEQDTPLKKIRAFIETLSRFNAENQVRMGVLLHDFRSLAEPRRAEIVRARDRYDKMLRKLIVEGQQQGQICADIDPKLSALAAMGMINTIYQWYRPGGDKRPEQIGLTYAEFVIRALHCTPEDHARGHVTDASALQVSA
jgi:TetR/AcrR family transcriptional regulator, cholesterol catabolism regulator